MVDELDEEVLDEREMRRTKHFFNQRQKYAELIDEEKEDSLGFDDAMPQLSAPIFQASPQQVHESVDADRSNANLLSSERRSVLDDQFDENLETEANMLEDTLT